MPKRILVIDDDTEILEILNLILKQEGYEVITSHTGETANDIQVIDPHLIILDIQINGSIKQGNQICSEIKSNHSTKKFPVILLSAEADVGIIGQECGADAYVRKPFDVNNLLAHIDRFII